MNMPTEGFGGKKFKQKSFKPGAQASIGLTKYSFDCLTTPHGFC